MKYSFYEGLMTGVASMMVAGLLIFESVIHPTLTAIQDEIYVLDQYLTECRLPAPTKADIYVEGYSYQPNYSYILGAR